MIPVYLIPGLGADARIFQRIVLPCGFQLHVLEWISPDGCRSISDYATCLLKQIDTSRPFLLGGVSLGGILSIEMAKQSAAMGVILISTGKTREEFPGLFRWVYKSGLYHSFTAKMLKAIGDFANRFTPVSPEGRALFLDMLYNTPDDLLVFGAKKAIEWKNQNRPKHIIHLHGSIDRVFPIKNIHSATMIKDGSHFMVFEKADEINQVLKKQLPALMERVG